MHHAIDQTRASEATVRYLLDGKGSRFTARAFATGLLSAFGYNPTIAIADFKGEAQVNASALEESSLRVVIQAESLMVSDDISDKDPSRRGSPFGAHLGDRGRRQAAEISHDF